MTGVVFQKDGAQAHNAKIIQDLLRKNVASFLAKATWTASSPDVSPIGNHMSILKDHIDPKGGSRLKNAGKTNKYNLFKNFSYLGNLIDGMANLSGNSIELNHACPAQHFCIIQEVVIFEI